MAQTISPQGVSGQKYAFTVYADNQQFKAVPAVYLLCKRLISGSYEVLYVGETQSLKDRFTPNHDGYVRAIKAGMTHIAVRSVLGDKDRLRVETDLRHGLNPSCNAQGVGTFRT